MAQGGKRIGAGRPKGSNLHGESTRPMRIPLSKIPAVQALIYQHQEGYKCPLYSTRIKAGFPSPADDHIEKMLDLNAHLIKHPSATFFVIASGDSMRDAGISSDDILVVDRSIAPTHGKIVIAAIQGELTVKRLAYTVNHSTSQNIIQLLPAHPDYPPIDISNEQDLIIWGVVTYVIHKAS